MLDYKDFTFKYNKYFLENEVDLEKAKEEKAKNEAKKQEQQKTLLHAKDFFQNFINKKARKELEVLVGWIKIKIRAIIPEFLRNKKNLPMSTTSLNRAEFLKIADIEPSTKKPVFNNILPINQKKNFIYMMSKKKKKKVNFIPF